MNKPVLGPKTVAVTRGPLPGSRKLLVDGVPFREVALSGGEPPVRSMTPPVRTRMTRRNRHREGPRRAPPRLDSSSRRLENMTVAPAAEDDGLRAGELLWSSV